MQCKRPRGATPASHGRHKSSWNMYYVSMIICGPSQISGNIQGIDTSYVDIDFKVQSVALKHNPRTTLAFTTDGRVFEFHKDYFEIHHSTPF
jgi:hypothetical protein